MSAAPPEEVTLALRRAMSEELIETLERSIAYLHRQLAALERMRQRDLDMAEKHMNEKHALQRQLDEVQAALRDIARQPLVSELHDDQEGDIGEGYDECIRVARRALVTDREGGDIKG